MASVELQARSPFQAVEAATIYSLPTCRLSVGAWATWSAAQTWGLSQDKQELGFWALLVKTLLSPLGPDWVRLPTKSICGLAQPLLQPLAPELCS